MSQFQIFFVAIINNLSDPDEILVLSMSKNLIAVNQPRKASLFSSGMKCRCCFGGNQKVQYKILDDWKKYYFEKVHEV